MKKVLAFDDVRIVEKFSDIGSREEVNTSVTFLGQVFNKAIISSNMDTVTEEQMARAMYNNGGIGCLHRFSNVVENVELYKRVGVPVIVSIGIGEQEMRRATMLYEAGARMFCIDVAHGASQRVVEFYNAFRERFTDVKVIVGNFASYEPTAVFLDRCNQVPNALKVGIGGGSACATTSNTGVGLPTFQSILDLKNIGLPLIADGGIRGGADYAKALAAGANMVMVGGMLAGTTEAPGPIHDFTGKHPQIPAKYVPDGIAPGHYKRYRGSASAESYQAQGKVAAHRAPEGASMYVPWVGSAATVLQEMDGWLRSSMSYVNAKNINEFRSKAEFVEVTNNGLIEGKPHRKTHG